MTRTILLSAFTTLMISATTAFAGTAYPMKCVRCGFSDNVMIGGGMQFEQITGFCVETGTFVYLMWDRGKKKPEPVAEAWDSSTGRTVGIYKCPDSGKPFIPLRLDPTDEDGPGFHHCPKCGKPTFHVENDQGFMMYD